VETTQHHKARKRDETVRGGGIEQAEGGSRGLAMMKERNYPLFESTVNLDVTVSRDLDRRAREKGRKERVRERITFVSFDREGQCVILKRARFQ
jgi:hypothetical protein